MHPLAAFALEHRHAGNDFFGLVGHCLPIEAQDGRVQVDSGLGFADGR